MSNRGGGVKPKTWATAKRRFVALSALQDDRREALENIAYWRGKAHVRDSWVDRTIRTLENDAHTLLLAIKFLRATKAKS